MAPVLEKIEIRGLFGYLSYDLENLDAEKSIFVIGNNGSGKSTVFRLIAALIDARWHAFHETTFDSLSFRFKDGKKKIEFKFRKRDNLEWKNPQGEWNPLVQGSWREFSEIEGTRQKAEWIFRMSSEIGRAKCGRHWTTPNRSHVNDIDLVRYWTDKNSPNAMEKEADSGETSHPDMSPLKPLKVQFIQANRLLALYGNEESRANARLLREDQRSPSRPPIHQISDLVREKLRSQVTGAFIQRDAIGNEALNKWISQGEASESSQFKSVHTLAEEIEKIESAFSEFSQTPHRTKLNIPAVLPAGYEPFLKFYLDSRLKQLSPLTGFLKQISLFSEICNTAFGYKKISLHEQRGLTVRVDIGNHADDLDLSDLSSGEQQIIFLAYQLTIGAEHDALILIDEPELSLHLDWQKTFTSLLDRIGEQTNNRYLCATHSPAIVGSRVSALRNIEVDDEY